MNFKKKNHEHKIVNVKNVSKKIILSMMFVFAISTFTQINASENINTGCAADAFKLQAILESQGYDMEFANDLANDWYEACVSIVE
jgi:hypothetical protein